jgi:hypothetical protein
MSQSSVLSPQSSDVSGNGVPPQSELVYVGKPSAAPAFVAVGLALMLAGIYGHGLVLPNWVYSVFGAIFFLAAVRRWVGEVRRDIAELPREQRVRSAVLPPR